MMRVAEHCSALASKLYSDLVSLRHANGLPVCEIYKAPTSTYGDFRSQGPIIALNMKNSKGDWVSIGEAERLAAVKNIQLRKGGLCNPGGISRYLGWEPEEMRENFAAGKRCDDERDIIKGKPTGVIRVSLGAMSNRRDIETFVAFLKEFYQETQLAMVDSAFFESIEPSIEWYVESLTVYPIKSCSGWSIPPGVAWDVREEGLAWDREWCLIHQGTGVALSQKKHPRMALLKPALDFEMGILRVRYEAGSIGVKPKEIMISLREAPCGLEETFAPRFSKVCSDKITALTYTSPAVAKFFSEALSVPCTLARFPASSSNRHSKLHLQPRHQFPLQQQMPGTFPNSMNATAMPLLLSNESPILVISRSSLNRLNEQIKLTAGKAATADAFRPNIVIAEHKYPAYSAEQPYVEDAWETFKIGDVSFQVLGPCRRCQMVCIDQVTAERNEEPFVTLAKTRRIGGKVFFGMHACLHSRTTGSQDQGGSGRVIRVGDELDVR